jgi:hypothetical protein
MATRTQPGKRPAPSRFARSTGTPAARPGGRRPSATPRSRSTIIARRKPQKSGMAKVMEGMAGALPKGAGKKGAGGGGKGRTAGLAMLAGAAGLALKNRGKLQGMIRGKGSDTGDRTSHADAPANPIVVTEGPASPDGPGASHPPTV